MNRVFKDKSPYILFGFGLLLIGFMHLFMLDRIPRGLNVDEIGAAYDAYALGHFGVDRWCKSWPVYMTNYRDGQNILYTYLLVPILRIFGTSAWAVRSVIAASSFVMAIFGSLTFRILHPDSRHSGPVFLLLFSVMPVLTMTMRFGLESHLMMGVAMILVWFAARTVTDGRNSAFLGLGITGGVILYTYALSYIAVPAFLFFLLICFLVKRELTARRFFLVALPFGALAWPLALVQAINLFDLPEIILGPFTFTKLPTYRKGEVMLSGFFRKIFYALKNTLLYDGLSYNSTEKFGNFYYISLPFLAIGLFVCLRRCIMGLKEKEKQDPRIVVILWALSELLMAGFLTNDPGYANLTRMNGVLAAWILLIAEGIWTVTELFKIEAIRKGAIVLITAAYAAFFVCFATYYFTDYDEEAYPYKWLFFEEYPEDAMTYIAEHRFEYSSTGMAYYQWLYIYYLFGSEADPRPLGLAMHPGERDPVYVDGYRMEIPHTLTGLKLMYDGPYNQAEIDWHRSAHSGELRFGQFLMMIPPFGNSTFFRQNVRITDTISMRDAEMESMDDVRCTLYAWLEIREHPEETVEVLLCTDDGEIPAYIITDEVQEDTRVVLYQFVMDYEPMYQSSQKNLVVRLISGDGSVTEEGQIGLTD